MIDFFNDFDKVNGKEAPKPETETQDATESLDAGEQAEGKEENTDFSKTLETLRNEITALKELLKNSSMGNSAGDENENKKESEDGK